jgi:2-oxoglutarate ferredoxin oxidoreductase subunit delta
MARGLIELDEGQCKGCGLCVAACPKDVIAIAEDRVNARGYHPAVLADPDGECTGCAVCAVACPDVAITVYRVKRRAV